MARHMSDASKKRRRRLIAGVAAILGIGSGLGVLASYQGPATDPPTDEPVNHFAPPTATPKATPKPSASKTAAPRPTPKPTVAKSSPSATPRPRPTPTPTASKPVVVPPSATKTAQLLSWLMAQVGKPYVYGATGPGAYDCSGLVETGFGRLGISLPRTSEEQSTRGTEVWRVGQSQSLLKPGDVLFWGYPGSAYHEAVYIGGGKYIAAENRREGVGIFTMSWSTPQFARRIL